MEEKPVVLILHGDDAFAINQFVEKLFARMGDPGLADLNTARLDGHSASAEEIRTAVSSIPFLADRRLILLSHPLARMNSETARAAFLRLLDSTPETSALVLIQEDSRRWDSKQRREVWESLNEDHWLMEWAVKAGKRVQVREFSLPRAEDMPGWISKTAREQGGQFSMQAAMELANLVGNDTRTASLEIDKLLTYVDRGRAVEVEDVADCTAGINPVNVFEMVDAIAVGDSSRALRLLRALLEEQDALPLFGAIVNHFRLLLLAREIIDEGGGSEQIINQLKRPKFVADKAYRQARSFSLAGLEDVYRRLAQMDEDMKTGVMPGPLALETFIATLKVA